MSKIENLRGRAGLVYGPEAQPGKISQDTALAIGRLLVESDYTVTFSMVIGRTSELTVKSLIKEYVSQKRRSVSDQQDILDGGGIIGPYYTISSEQGEYCPGGIAIWIPRVEPAN